MMRPTISLRNSVFLGLIGLLLIPLIVVRHTHAASAQSVSTQSALSVNPAITEQVLIPGETITTTVRLTNITDVPLPIYGSANNLIPQEKLLKGTDKAIYDASDWFTIDPANFILQPKESKDITITIATPVKASPGGHYATIYFEPLLPASEISSSTTYLAARVGVLALLIVKGDIVEHASVGDVRGTNLHQFGPVALSAALTNNGTVHLLPQGSVIIRNWRGKQVANLPLNTGLILPKTTRRYAVTWDNNFRIGYYTAEAKITYGSANRTVTTGQVGFWILPWIPVVFLILLLSAIVWFIHRTRHRWRATWRTLVSNK